MTLVEAIKIKNRICCNSLSCEQCILNKFSDICSTTENVAKAIEEILRKWEDEHPLTTNREKFIQTFGSDVILKSIKEKNLDYFDDWLDETYEEFYKECI